LKTCHLATLLVPWILVGADVVEERLLSRRVQVDEVEDEAEADDPRGQERGPESVVDGRRISQPENEDVLDDGAGVDFINPF
jgi:hypothetical protein